MAAKELAHYYEVILNKLQNTKIRQPLTTQEMEHILKVADEKDKEREEKLLEYKYVYQTKLTKDTVNERIRSPMRMWDTQETFIDNNLQHILDRLHEYYDE